MLGKITEFFNSPGAYIHDGFFNIRIIFDRITGNKLMFILYVIATIYILVKVKDKKKNGLLVFYPILLACVVCCPIFFYLVKTHLQEVYFRFFWLFPAGIVVAYAGVNFIYNFGQKHQRIASLIGCIAVIAICGKFIYTNENFIKVHNLYKIPDEAKWVTDIITQDESEDKYVLAVPEIVPYIRQVNSNIRLAYGRDVAEAYEEWWPVQIKEGNARKMLLHARGIGINYVVLYNNVELDDLTYKYGYHILAQTYSYDIYKYK